MIVERVGVNNMPMTLAHMATAVQAQTVRKPQKEVNVPDLCYCECIKPLKVFGKVGGDDSQKDQTSVLEKKTITADTIAFELIKEGVKVADLDDNTYGTYYDYGSINSDQLLTGYLLDWTAVLTALGVGRYQIRTIKTIIGVESTTDSAEYFLSNFSDLQADDTVRLDIRTSGEIERTGIDLGTFEWFQSIRVFGELIKVAPDFEKDVYMDSGRNERKFQSKTINNYTLNIFGVNASLGDYMTDEFPHANSIELTDYNLIGYRNYSKLKITTESFETFETSQDRAILSLNLREESQNIVKHY